MGQTISCCHSRILFLINSLTPRSHFSLIQVGDRWFLQEDMMLLDVEKKYD